MIIGAYEKTTKSKYFENKTKIIGCVLINNSALDKEVFAPLKYLSNFWRSLNLPLINCEIEHDLSWSRDILSEEILNTPKNDANPDSNPPILHAPATSTTSS